MLNHRGCTSWNFQQFIVTKSVSTNANLIQHQTGPRQWPVLHPEFFGRRNKTTMLSLKNGRTPTTVVGDMVDIAVGYKRKEQYGSCCWVTKSCKYRWFLFSTQKLGFSITICQCYSPWLADGDPLAVQYYVKAPIFGGFSHQNGMLTHISQSATNGQPSLLTNLSTIKPCAS